MKNLVLTRKLIAILFFFTGMIYIGCQKEDVKVSETKNQSNTQLRTNVTPTVENGTLKFETEADAVAYYNELKILSSTNEGFNTSSLNLSNFNSLINTETNSDLQSNSFRFLDDEYAFMLNNNYEIIIGSKLRVQKSLQEYYSIDKNDEVSMNVLRNVEPGNVIDIKDLNDNINVLGDERQIFKLVPEDILVAPPLGCECRASIESVKIKGVAVPGRYIFKVFCKGITGSPTITINFGDGLSTQGSISNSNPEFRFDKTYSQGTGQVNVVISVNLPCGRFTSTRILNPSANCCSNFFDSGWKEKCENSNCIRYTLQVFNNNLGVRSSQAKLYSIQNNNGVYSNSTTSLLKIDMESFWRFCEIEAVCNVQSNDSTVKQCTNCKDVKETHNNYSLFSDPDCNKTGDVYARYKRNVSGIGLIEGELSAVFCN
jgi:hypothetical protein